MRLGVLGIILAGGKGTRLFPLTKERAKPAVPFGGKYRIVDFVLSNFINSGIHSIYVLTQFKSQSLLQHLSDGWQFGGLLKEQFIIPVPAQMRSAGETWYRGTAPSPHRRSSTRWRPSTTQRPTRWSAPTGPRRWPCRARWPCT